MLVCCSFTLPGCPSDYRPAAATRQYQEFMFLQGSLPHHLPRRNTEQSLVTDTIPSPISLADALKRREAKQKEVLEENPATAPPTAPPTKPSTATAPSTSSASKTSKPPAKDKAPQTNGKSHTQPKTNGTSTATNGGTKRQREKRSRQSHPEVPSAAESSTRTESTSTMETRRRSSRASRGEASTSTSTPPTQTHTPPHVNGTHSPTPSENARGTGQWGGLMGPPRLPYQPPAVDHEDTTFGGVARSESIWPPSHFTGPASGYLEDHRLIFGGRGPITANPGRTIYSQQRSPDR